MKIHECARCEGCGYITGSLRWEVAWSRWADAKDPRHAEGVLEAHPCPDCGGTGALILMDEIGTPDAKLPTRRGLNRQQSYAEHVASVLLSRPATKH